MNEKKKFYKRWWFWGIVIVLIAIGLSTDDEEVAEEPKVEESASGTEEEKVENEDDSEPVKKDETTEEENEVESETETEVEVETEPDTTEIGKATIAALESNDFYAFVEEYKKLETDKTPVWDEHLNGKKVTWTGTVVRAGTSQLFVYGGSDYNGESWTELGDDKKLFYTFVAKYADGTADEFKKLQTGDKVTVEGDLESRGDFDLNFNWKIYNATLK